MVVHLSASHGPARNYSFSGVTRCSLAGVRNDRFRQGSAESSSCIVTAPAYPGDAGPIEGGPHVLSIIVSVAALLVAFAAALYARQSAQASDRSAKAAEAADRRARTPQLRFFLDHPVEAPIENVIYRVRNEGPQDLVRITVFRPKPPGGITYPIAVTGAGAGYAEDEIQLGPLALTKEARFTFCCGAAEDLPEFLVRVECAAGNDEWKLSLALPFPRPVLDPLGSDPKRTLKALEAARAVFQDLVSRGGDDKAFFLDPKNKFIGQGLGDSAGRTGNKPLKQAILAVAGSWDKASATAPPDPGPRVINLNDIGRSFDPEYERRLHEVADVAQDGLDKAVEALAQLTALGG